MPTPEHPFQIEKPSPLSTFIHIHNFETEEQAAVDFPHLTNLIAYPFYPENYLPKPFYDNDYNPHSSNDNKVLTTQLQADILLIITGTNQQDNTPFSFLVGFNPTTTKSPQVLDRFRTDLKYINSNSNPDTLDAVIVGGYQGRVTWVYNQLRDFHNEHPNMIEVLTTTLNQELQSVFPHVVPPKGKRGDYTNILFDPTNLNLISIQKPKPPRKSKKKS